MSRITTTLLQDKKAKKEKITMLTSYDYSTAVMVDQAGIDCILVGDSLGNVILGYDSTLPVTMDDMIHHTRAVSRGAKNSLVVGDMPFLSYHVSIPEAIRSGVSSRRWAGGEAGGGEEGPTLSSYSCPILVMGHRIDSSLCTSSGFWVQEDLETAEQLLRDARALDEAGVFSIVLECVPAALARRVTAEVSVPTIGIGAGPDCDGQVLVINDMLGMYQGFVPKFVKKFANLQPVIAEALQSYKEEVEKGTFPADEHCFAIKEEVLEKLY